jgi:hypothetical protein
VSNTLEASIACAIASPHGWPMLADAGVPEEVRQSLTGHSSSRIHQNYTHFDSAPVEAIKKLPSFKSKD